MIRRARLAYYRWRLARLKQAEQRIAIKQMRAGWHIGNLGGNTSEAD